MMFIEHFNSQRRALLPLFFSKAHHSSLIID